MEIKIGTTTVATVLNAKRAYIARKISNAALDGSAYVQSVGRASETYEIDAYCATGANRNAIDSACNTSEMITLVLDNANIGGFITDETIDWKEWPDGHGVGHFTLARF